MRYPLRGEVWLIDLGLAAKIRPCLIISAPIGDSDRALITADLCCAPAQKPGAMLAPVLRPED